MESQHDNRAARVFADAFAGAFAKSLTQETGTPWQLKGVDDAGLSPRQGQTVHYRMTLEGAVRGECFVEFYEPQAIELASQLVRRRATAFTDELSEALAEAIQVSMPGVAGTLLSEFGDFRFKVERASGLAYGGMFVVPLAATVASGSPMPVLLYFDNQLLAALSPPPAGHAVASPANLGLVMDVELNVTLRFGQRQLPLRDVLELASGSVIELDRQVDDPVELLLDGKVIARGEAVIVDGNYGLRVTEIPQPMASHFTR